VGITISLFVHMLGLLSLFFFYRSSNEHFTIFMRQPGQTDLDITLLPSLAKNNKNIFPACSAPKAKQNLTQNTITKSNKNHSVAQKQSLKQKNQKKKLEPLEKETNVLSTAPKTAVLEPKQEQRQRQPAKKIVSTLKEKSKLKDEEKIASLSNNFTKTIKQEPTKNNIVQKEPPAIENIKTTQAFSDASTEHQLNALSLEELETLKKINYLETELARVWHPPVIQKTNPSCTLELFISWSGIIESIKIIESSKIPLFDAAARKALQSMHIPEWAKGKSITIVLKA
jgi:outer membrane biosynthesis protein TonB